MSVEESLKLATKELTATGEVQTGNGKTKSVRVSIRESGGAFPIPSWYVHVTVDFTATTKGFWRYKSALKYFKEIVEKFGFEEGRK